jgi:hypothetical protein
MNTRLLSPRHTDELTAYRVEARTTLENAKLDSESPVEQFNIACNYYKDLGYDVNVEDTKDGTAATISDGTITFEIKLYKVGKGRVTLGRTVKFRLEAVEEDVETWDSIRSKHYRFNILNEEEDMKEVEVRSFDWSKLEYFDRTCKKRQ